MNNIHVTSVEDITRDYVANGNHTHFRLGGKIIKGYQFTRKQLNDLIKNNGNTELFIMLALSTESGSKYLNIVVAGMLNGMIDLGTMIISDKTYTGNISFLDDSIKIRSLLVPAEPITPAQLNTMQTNFGTADSGHLNCTTTKRIKAYTLSTSDLATLKLDTVTPGNQNDIFMFMPVIRRVRPGDPADARDYVSLAVARFDTTTQEVKETIMEYCLPCPSTCATNYWHR